MPTPGAFDDLVHVRELRSPPKLIPDFAAGRNENGRISFSPGHDLRMDLSARDRAYRFDHLLYGEPFAVTEIVKAAPFVECLQCKNMRLREINDVHVVTNTGAIACWVVGSKYQRLLPFSHGDINHDRDEMQFRI